MSLKTRIDKIERRLNTTSNIKYPSFSEFFLSGNRTTWVEWMRANNRPSKTLDRIIAGYRSFDSFYDEAKQ